MESISLPLTGLPKTKSHDWEHHQDIPGTLTGLMTDHILREEPFPNDDTYI